MKHASFLASLCLAMVLSGCGRGTEPIVVTIPDADDTGHITREFTCMGGSKSLRFRLADIPQDVVSIAMIFDDSTAPGGTFTHWVVYNAPGNTAWLTADRLPDGTQVGLSSIDAPVYVPPCPPSGLHQYTAEVLGLDTTLTFAKAPTADELRAAAAKHVVASGTATVTYNVASAEDDDLQ